MGVECDIFFNAECDASFGVMSDMFRGVKCDIFCNVERDASHGVICDVFRGVKCDTFHGMKLGLRRGFGDRDARDAEKSGS